MITTTPTNLNTDPKKIYELIEMIGKGSFGKVYRAIHKKSNKVVAIKVIDFLNVVNGDDIEDIKNEVSILSQMKSEFVTRYWGSYVNGSNLWIVMEYCDGGSCLDLIKDGVLNECEISILMFQLLKALEYVHSIGKIHRDIKAANILVTGDGRLKLADFGVSAEITAAITKKNTFVGTPFWMAPEVIVKSAYNSKADIWSMGITAFELATGLPPHADLHVMRVLFIIPREDAPVLNEKKFSCEFRDFVACCLEKKASIRPNATQLLQHPFIKRYAHLDHDVLKGSILKYRNWKLKNFEKETVFNNTNREENIAGQSTGAWSFPTINNEETLQKKPSALRKPTTRPRTLGRGIAFADEFDTKPFDSLEDSTSIIKPKKLKVSVSCQPKEIIKKIESNSIVYPEFIPLDIDSSIYITKSDDQIVHDEHVDMVVRGFNSILERENGKEIGRSLICHLSSEFERLGGLIKSTEKIKKSSNEESMIKRWQKCNPYLCKNQK